jgi:enoyl-CoA hydratase
VVAIATEGPQPVCAGEADELDDAVAGLAKEIVVNSPGTNRIVKRLIADGKGRTRTDALAHERTRPHGTPADMAARMQAGGR